MKHTIITIVIAVITGLCGYFFAINKTKITGVLAKSITEELKIKQYKVETLIQINDYSRSCFKKDAEQFISAELEALKSCENLTRAIKDYHLEKLLNMGESELLGEMKAGIEIMPLRGTYLLTFNVSADTELKAQQISYAVLYSYREIRGELLDKSYKDYKKSLREKLKEQELIVEQKRVKLQELSKKLGVPYPKSDNLDTKTPEEMIRFGRAKDEYERELSIEEAIGHAQFETAFRSDLQQDPLIFHSQPWAPELHETMQLTK